MRRIITGACLLINTMLLLSAAGIEPIITGLETADMKVGESEKWMWDKMWEAKMLTDEQLSHVYTYGRLPGGTVVIDSPLGADRQAMWSKLAVAKVVTGEELAQMLMGGSISNMSPREVRAFEELAPVWEPDPAKRFKYDVRMKHIAVEAIRWKQGRGAELKRSYQQALAEAEERDIPVRWQNPNGRAAVLSGFDAAGNPEYWVTFNAAAAASMNTTAVRPGGSEPFGLTGTNILVGVLDFTSVRTTHQEFATARVVQEAPYGQHPHSTQIAGTIAARGEDAAAKGMAPEAGVVVNCDQPPYSVLADWSIDRPGLHLVCSALGRECGWVSRWYAPSVLVWGGTTNLLEDEEFGAYTRDAWEWDNLLYDNPYQTLVVPVGNDSGETYWPQDHWCQYYGFITNDVHPPDGSYPSDPHDCVPPSATMKNALAVGSAYPTGGTGLLSYAMVSSSSVGWTDDGRMKPDVIGCGNTVYTCHDGSDTNYSCATGTSFSAAAVVGSLALVQELHERIYSTNSPMLSSTMRALAMHTAHDIGLLGPDRDSGWGVLDTSAACWAVSNNAAYYSSLPHIFEVRIEDTGTNATATRTTFVTNTPPFVKWSIGWTDPVGSQPPDPPILDDDTPVLVNDIDLRVISPDGVTNKPWCPWLGRYNGKLAKNDNTVDNFEQVSAIQTVGRGRRHG